MMSDISNTSTTLIDPDHPPTTEAFWEGAVLVLKRAGQPIGVVKRFLLGCFALD